MAKRNITQAQKDKIDGFLEGLYLDIQGPPGSKSSMTEEYVIKLVTRFLVSICTAWWSITELIEYVRTKRSFKEFLNDE